MLDPMHGSGRIYFSGTARIIDQLMAHSNIRTAPLLLENLRLIKELEIKSGVLDLACGSGRNGRFLLQHQIPVTFADRNREELKKLEAELGDEVTAHELWQVDLESGTSNPLAEKSFDSILVFNYLHRPLIPAIRDAVRAGGLVFYETFTVEQARLGRPTNPDFLLQYQELLTFFDGWQILHQFEGVMKGPERAVANLIARKP